MGGKLIRPAIGPSSLSNKSGFCMVSKPAR
uniref:Uncharacterized protein n=1 Tax=Arundo donax TaxID=35708 RepID=A0A0A8ZM23_ARUDO